MKVLLVSDFAPPVRGGLEFHVDLLASELADRGHEVHLATMTANVVATSAQVRVHVVESASRFLPHEAQDRPFHPPLPDPVAYRQLAKVVASVKPDVIHAHSWLGVSLSRRSKIPLVLTAHDYGYICQLRTLLRPDSTICSGPTPKKCFHCARQTAGVAAAALMTPGTVAGRRHLRPSALLAVSRAVATALQPHFNIDIAVVPNFVGIEPALEPLPTSLPGSDFVLYAGDPGDHKGVPDLLRIWAKPDAPKVPLVLATTKPLAVPANSNVIVTALTRGQMATAWRAATIAIVPSRWPDPCPTVALEALRAGTPVIGTNIGGLLDIVRDGVDGFLVDPGDQPAIRDRIERLLTKPELLISMEKSARLRVIGFTAEPVVNQIVHIYERVQESR